MKKDMTPQKSPAINKNPKPSLKFQREKDEEKVRGLFRYFEVPGGEVSFVYRAYRGEPMKKYTLKDNTIYTLPLGVARHLNKNVKYPIHAYSVDANGNKLQGVGKMKARCSFQSLDFMDIEDLREMGDESAQLNI